MYPRSGFRSGGTCERTLVSVFVSGEHPNVPSFRSSLRGNIRQNHLLENHPFVNPRTFFTLDTVFQGNFQDAFVPKIPLCVSFAFTVLLCALQIPTIYAKHANKFYGSGYVLIGGINWCHIMIQSLRYTISRNTSSVVSHFTRNVRYPPLRVSCEQTNLCDTPFCSISHGTCAIPHKIKCARVCSILCLQAWCDMKCIAAGPPLLIP